MKRCPRCGIANLDSAERCECGESLLLVFAEIQHAAETAQRPRMPPRALEPPAIEERPVVDASKTGLRVILEVVSRVLWAGALIGAVLGGIEFVLTYGSRVGQTGEAGISAPQLAALAASCMTYAVIPYVLARAWDELTRSRLH